MFIMFIPSGGMMQPMILIIYTIWVSGFTQKGGIIGMILAR